MAIQVGDLVQLISGGPKMTAHSKETPDGSFEPYWYCKWFDGAKLTDGNFKEATLQKVEANSEQTKTEGRG